MLSTEEESSVFGWVGSPFSLVEEVTYLDLKGSS